MLNNIFLNLGYPIGAVDDLSKLIVLPRNDKVAKNKYVRNSSTKGQWIETLQKKLKKSSVSLIII